MAEASNTSYHSDEEIDRILEELEQYPSAPEPVPEPEPAPSPAKPSWRRELWEWLRSLGIAAIAALLLFHYVIAFVSVKGRSMEPNVSEGDFLAVSGLFYTPKTGDIVVLSAKNGLKERLIKRVIATGGQTVDIVDGAVFIDGVKLEEPYPDRRFHRPGGAELSPDGPGGPGLCHGRQPEPLHRQPQPDHRLRGGKGDRGAGAVPPAAPGTLRAD